MSKEVKVRILDMSYDQENNLFQIKIEEIVGDNKQVILAVSGMDFMVTKDTPLDIVEQFCSDMIGKEKNLHIERVISTIANKDMPIDSMNRAYDDTVGYPINEVRNILNSNLEGNMHEG